MAVRTVKYGVVRIHYKDGTYEDFKDVDLGSIEIDDFDYIHFKRLNKESMPAKWTEVVLDLENQAKYYETTED